MADWGQTTYGSIVGSYGRLWISINRTDSGATSSLEVYVGFASKYSVSDTNNTFYFDDLSSPGSATTSLGTKTIKTTVDTGSGWSSSNSIKIHTYTATYTRGTAASTRYLYAQLKGIDRVGGIMYVGATVTIPALDSYTVKYNANGGSGAPSSQTKWYGQTLTLSSTKPTRTGYSFQGWALTQADANNNKWYYQPGGTCGKNENLTLYAVWKANTYTVVYNANGGTGAPGNQTKTYGVSLTLSSTIPTRTNYTFKGWGTSASAMTASYAAGGSYTANAGITLYAIWELTYVKPRINGFSVKRCTSDATVNDEGTYALVAFNWACDRTVTAVTIEWKLSSESTWSSTTVSASGTSGGVAQVIGGSIDPDSTYDVRVTVADSGGSFAVTGSLMGTAFSIDILAEGKGIAFGKPAELSDYMDVGYKARFRDWVYLSNARAIHGQTNDGRDIDLLHMNENNLTVIGWGDYANEVNATHIYGNYVDLYSKNNITFHSAWNIDFNAVANVNVKAPMHLEVTTDAEGTANNNPALTVGTTSGAHLELDGNEIMAKASGNTTTSLYLNAQGGNVCLNDNKIGSTFVRGCRIAENKVLWSGGWYMSADHTANLEENISDQANGVVLVWSFYENGAAQDYAWNMVFVPKYLMSVAGGTGMSMFLTTATGNSVATKYLYIHNSKIVGYTNSSDNNIGNAGGSRTTTSGITLTPRAFVLRYVIGV